MLTLRRDVLGFARKCHVHIGHVDIKHSDMDFFEDVPVEVHFMPSWFYCPTKNKKLFRFFDDKAEMQFRNYDANAGFTHTTVDFDLVYSLVHIYRHIFEEGIGFRHLLDYYNVLLHSDEQQREEAFIVLRGLGMSSFAGGVMCVLHKCFAMDKDYFLCAANEQHGRLLLSEILMAGNFGQYDERNKHSHGRWTNGLQNVKRNVRFLRYYPSEVLWSPFWKIWHYCWRMRKGYFKKISIQ